MRAIASADRRRLLPKSLMQRLALVANGQLPPARDEGTPPQRRAANFGTLLWFGLGALASGAIGGVAFLGLHALAGTRLAADSGVVPARLAGRVPTAVMHEAAPQIADVAVDRSERARAPLPLAVTGTEDPGLRIVVQGVPPAARLSRGERQGELTWVLDRADLDGLYMTLGDATPDAFDMQVDVLVPPGVATQGSVVRVRLVDTAPQKQAAAATSAKGQHEETVAMNIAEPAPAHISPSGAGVSDARRPPAARRRQEPPAASVAAVQAAARPWPEGASALGAIPRDSERQVWWNMPPPIWSPFQPAGTN